MTNFNSSLTTDNLPEGKTASNIVAEEILNLWKKTEEEIAEMVALIKCGTISYKDVPEDQRKRVDEAYKSMFKKG